MFLFVDMNEGEFTTSESITLRQDTVVSIGKFLDSFRLSHVTRSLVAWGNNFDKDPCCMNVVWTGGG